MDEKWAKIKESTGFAPSERPKTLRRECKEAIYKKFEEKIESCGILERATDKSWFSNHLFNINTQLINDLVDIKELCVPCFPPSYKIFNFSVKNVHNLISNYLKLVLDENKLKDQEYFVLLSWLRSYRSEHSMGNPRLNLELSKVPELLEEKYYEIALNSHLEWLATRLSYLFQNIIVKDFVQLDSKPIIYNSFYKSNMSNDLMEVLKQQLDLDFSLNDDNLSKRTLVLIVKQLNQFIDNLKSNLFLISF